MKSLVDYIKEVKNKQEDSELQLAELSVNQEYTNCLLELNQTTE